MNRRFALKSGHSTNKKFSNFDDRSRPLAEPECRIHKGVTHAMALSGL
jgi:hypothetical protein